MIIKIPNNFIPERKYIISTLLNYFKNINYEIQTHTNKYWLFEYNNHSIKFNDAFFPYNKSSYLDEKFLPNKPIFLPANKFYPEKLPFLYGEAYFEQKENEIHIGADLFASAFFMLTRWEEIVIKQKDRHNRFPDKLNYSKKNNLHHRPLVCEYVIFLKNLLHFIGINTQINRKYELWITHDVDVPERYDNFITFLKTTTNDILKRKSLKMAINGTIQYTKKILAKAKDPYDNFDFIMKISEKYNQKSHFYFIPSLKKEPKAFYDYNKPEIKNLVKKIQQRGHIIGLHASYRSYNNAEIFKQEIQRFINAYNIIPTEGRQHFLRFVNPTTWQLWEQNGLKIDSTLGFYSDIGFRAGSCYPYRVFDVIERKTLNLIEMPLIVMDGAMALLYPQPSEFIKKLSQIKKIVQKFNGTFVFLWHTNSFVLPPFDKLGKYYEEIIKTIIK